MASNKFKEFKLSSLALNNGTSVFILLFMIIFLGFSAYRNMPKELFPEITIPTIYVSTAYPGNSPLDMENLVTRPLEKEIQPINGIKTLSSTSIQDFSAIVVEFNTDVDVDEVLLEVKDAVDKAKKDLPNDLPAEPSVMEVDFSEMPILNINLSGDFSIDNLKMFAEDLQDEIEAIAEISEVEIKGVLDREIKVNVDLYKMQANEISFFDIENAIANENISMAGGEIEMQGTRRSLRLVGEFKSAKELEDVIVKHEKGNIVYLRDIADVEDGYKSRSSYARLDGFPVVSLDVKKKSGENLLLATEKINQILADAKGSKLPTNLTVTITNDQSKQTKDQLKNLENSIISGVILVVAVLFFFLGIRNALFVGLAIPLSMFMSFLILSAMGVTINMIVLFALILALGMLVDNAIVIIENIYRLYEEEDMKLMDACKQGVGEVAIPIIASTATTLAAFFPLLFWNDLMGEFMGYIPLTLITVLASSLFIALVINPVVAKTFMKKESEEKSIKKSTGLKIALAFAIVSALMYGGGMNVGGSVFGILAVLGILDMFILRRVAKHFKDVSLVKFEAFYSKVLKAALKGKRPYFYVIGTFALLIFSIWFFGNSGVKTEFFPVNEPQYVNMFIEAPIGTDIEKTDSVTKYFEKEVNQILEDDAYLVESVVANVGTGTSDPNAGPAMGGDTPNKAKITITFVDFVERNGASTSEVLKKLTAEMPAVPGYKVSIEKNQEGPPTGKPINLELIGEDLTTLMSIAEEVQREIDQANIAGIEGLKADIELGKPELIIEIDRAKARRFGLSTLQIGGTIRTALFGKEVSKFKDGEDEYPIQLRLQDSRRNSISDLMNQRITFRDQATGKIAQVPISSVASYSYNTTYGSVKRKDMDRAITLYSNVIEGYNATEINLKLKELMAEFDMPSGYSYKFTGQQEEQEKTFAFLSMALVMAVALIALILVSQFNSLIKPLIIILSVLFSTIGVFLGIAAFKMDFVVIMTGIGIISLAGIVVNNAIVLIDYINLLKSRKREELGLSEEQKLSREDIKEAVIMGGKTRLRPVLLTAITTILGLLPLATGMNIDFYGLLASFNPDIYFGGDNAIFWGPMAWTVIFGLTFATFLTLVIVPVMYMLTEFFQIRMHESKLKRQAAK